MNKVTGLNKFNTIIFCLLLNALISSALIDKNIIIFFLLIFNGSLNLLNMVEVIKLQNISLRFFVNFFFYLFFFLVPVIHYNFNHFNYFFDSKSTYSYAESSLLLLSVFNISYAFRFIKVKKARKPSFFTEITSLTDNTLYLWFIVIIALIVLVSLGPKILLFRTNEFSKSSSDSMLKVMAFTFFFRPLMFFIALIEYKKRKGTKKVYELTFIFILVLGVLFNLPSATARFYTLFLAVVLIASLVMKKSTSKLLIPLVISFGVNFSFFFSNLRFLTSLSDINISNVSLDTRSFINSIHFDAFEVSLLSLKYVEKSGYTFGNNIVGSVLFFVPRSIWHGKPEPSGALIINKQVNVKLLEDETFTNISFPLISEFYIAFGFIGVILLGVFLRKVTICFDDNIRYSINNIKNQFLHFDLNIIFIASFVGLSIFILRGTLMVAYSYSLSILFSFFIALKVCGIKYKFQI